MTLNLKTVAPVAGESAMRIRDILRLSRRAFREDWLSDRFRYELYRACELARAMEAAGYVQRDRERELRSKSTLLRSPYDSSADFYALSADIDVS